MGRANRTPRPGDRIIEPPRFDASPSDTVIIKRIADRAGRDYPQRWAGLGTVSHLNLRMDITAVHCNHYPLRLQALLEAPAFDFAHDLLGIERHLDRTTGQLMNCFVPRFAVPVSERKGGR